MSKGTSCIRCIPASQIRTAMGHLSATSLGVLSGYSDSPIDVKNDGRSVVLVVVELFILRQPRMAGAAGRTAPPQG